MLQHATGFIRKVGRVLETRSIPELRFLADTTASDAEQMDDMIAEALRRDRQVRGDGNAGDGDASDGDASDGPN